MKTWLDGKKTYIVAIVTFLMAGYLGLRATYPDLGLPEIPEWVYAVLGAAGIITFRAAIGKAAPLLMLGVLLLSFGCQSATETHLGLEGIDTQGQASYHASMDATGTLKAVYPGTPPTMFLQDDGTGNGQWTITPGNGGLLKVANMSVWSPGDVEMEDVAYTPEPAAGKPMLSIKRVSANRTASIVAYNEQVLGIIKSIEGMNQQEAVVLLQRAKELGTLDENAAAIIEKIIPLLSPIPSPNP